MTISHTVSVPSKLQKQKRVLKRNGRETSKRQISVKTTITSNTPEVLCMKAVTNVQEFLFRIPLVMCKKSFLISIEQSARPGFVGLSVLS